MATTNVGNSQVRAIFLELNKEAERFSKSPPMESVVVQNPNGGIRTELREITLNSKTLAHKKPVLVP